MTTLKETFRMQISRCIHKLTSTIFHFKERYVLPVQLLHQLYGRRKCKVYKKNLITSKEESFMRYDGREGSKEMKKSEGKIIIVTFDFQVVLPATSTFCYKRKINRYSSSVTKTQSDYAVFFWHEGEVNTNNNDNL